MLILKTDRDKYSRGLSFNISNNDNWIDVAYYCLKEQIKIASITYEGKNESWFQWNDLGHDHDNYGTDLRTVNLTNQVMIERGVTNIVIDTNMYNGTETFKFYVI